MKIFSLSSVIRSNFFRHYCCDEKTHHIPNLQQQLREQPHKSKKSLHFGCQICLGHRFLPDRNKKKKEIKLFELLKDDLF